jgi:response regulator NasT
VSVIVVFEGEKDREAIASLLEKNGLPVRCACRGGQEAIRAAKRRDGSVIVCGYKFPDMTAEHMAHQLSGNDVTILMVARGTLLDLVENESIFCIPAPFRPAELVGAVRVLEQLSNQHRRGAGKSRSQDEKEQIDRAKALLMAHSHYTEEEAHRCLQRQSMETSLKLTEVARLVIETYESN